MRGCLYLYYIILYYTILYHTVVLEARIGGIYFLDPSRGLGSTHRVPLPSQEVTHGPMRLGSTHAS